MKKYIIEKIKTTIEEKKFEWAQNYMAKKYQQSILEKSVAAGQENAEAQKQVDSADVNMAQIEMTISFLNDLLKSETPTKRTK